MNITDKKIDKSNQEIDKSIEPTDKFFEKYQNASKKQLALYFINACEKGDLKSLDYLLTSNEIQEKTNFNTNYKYKDGLILACRNGHLEIIKYLFNYNLKEKYKNSTQDELTNEVCQNGHLDIIKYLLEIQNSSTHKNFKLNKFNLETVFCLACKYGHLEIVKYLLTSPDLIKHVDISANDDAGLFWACFFNHKEIVKYLLNSPDLKKHSNVNVKNNNIINNMCINGNLDIIKYLLNNTNLINKKEIYDTVCFIPACQANQFEVVKYFIYDIKMQKTNNIINFLHQNKEDEFIKKVISLFSAREEQLLLKRKMLTKKTINKNIVKI